MSHVTVSACLNRNELSYLEGDLIAGKERSEALPVCTTNLYWFQQQQQQQRQKCRELVCAVTCGSCVISLSFFGSKREAGKSAVQSAFCTVN